VSDFIAQYEVPSKTGDGLTRFRDPNLNFVSEDTLEGLRKAILELVLKDFALALLRNDETGMMGDAAPLLYENFLSKMITSKEGLCCTKQYLSFTGKISSDAWVDCNLRLEKLVRGGAPPTYDKMEMNTLYYPMKENFPFVEFFSKAADGTLTLFQVTRQKSTPKYFTISAFEMFLKAIAFPEAQVNRLKLIFIPGPLQVGKVYLATKAAEENAPILLKLKGYTVLRIDELYNYGLLEAK
jgi:hypothetical protein